MEQPGAQVDEGLAAKARSGEARRMISRNRPPARCPLCDGACDTTGAGHFDERTQTQFTLWECGGCKLRHWSPLVHPTGSYYEDEAQAMYVAIHEGSRDGSTDPRFQRFLADFGGARGKRLLDIGCADGALIELFARQDNRVEGIDIDRVAIDVARSRGLDARVETLDERVARAPAAELDFVTMFDVLEHVTAPLHFLHKASSLLRPGGHLVGTVPNRERILVDMHLSDFPPHHFLRFDAGSIRRALEIAGLRVERVDVFQYGYVGPALLASAVRSVRGLRRRAPAAAPPSPAAATPSPAERSARPAAQAPSIKRQITTRVNAALATASAAIESRLHRGYKLYFVATRT